MAGLTIPRRTLLRGAGGAALALPALEIMRGSRGALAAGAIKRFVICHAGCSIGGCLRTQDGRWDFVTPMNEGANYEIPLGLEAIKTEGVQSEMGLVSGLYMPVAGAVSPGTPIPSSFPRAGTCGFHGGTHVPQFAGKTMYSAEERDRAQNPCYPSCDQIAAGIVSSSDQYMKTLPLQLEYYYGAPGSAGDYGYLSWEAPGAGAAKDPYGRPMARGILPHVQPSDIFRKLFDPSGAASSLPSNQDFKTALEARKRHKTSVLDMVYKKTQRLISRLGEHDRLQMERWRDQLRTLETQIQSIDPGKCMPPAPLDYGKENDPKQGSYYSKNPDGTEKYDASSGWSDETRRATMQADLIHAAFMCDRTRVVSWLMTGVQSNLNMLPISGIASEMHAVSHTHNGLPDHMGKAVNWHIAPIARLVKHLMGTKDFDGSWMIDNTVILMIFEGGWGRNISGGDPGNDGYNKLGNRFSHSTDHMVVMMAGGKNLGLKRGQHIRLPFYMEENNNMRNVHPGQVVLTALRALGHTGPFGDVPDRIVREMMV